MPELDEAVGRDVVHVVAEPVCWGRSSLVECEETAGEMCRVHAVRHHIGDERKQCDRERRHDHATGPAAAP